VLETRKNNLNQRDNTGNEAEREVFYLTLNFALRFLRKTEWTVSNVFANRTFHPTPEVQLNHF